MIPPDLYLAYVLACIVLIVIPGPNVAVDAGYRQLPCRSISISPSSLACAVLIVIPGPNVALIVANSVAHGTRFGLLTVAGTSSAVVVQLALTVLGATAVLNFLAASFDWLRWVGVAYLVWLGIAAWRAPAVDLARVGPQARSARLIYARGFLVGLTNPKTLLFYGAFLPQFITPGPTAADQLLLLAVTFLVVAVAPRQRLGAAGRPPARAAGWRMPGCAIASPAAC